tara:strand:+ start:193168 stop:194133 length:966 start_codon:yes stop_codon:yes gene_type:complete
MPQHTQQGEEGALSRNSSDSVIARQLTGKLFCIACGYDLHGLSIRAECPECGVPVRATILGIVDPHADELTPLTYPRLSAIGLNLWSFGALVAVLMIWFLRGIEVLRDLGVSTWIPSVFAWVGFVGLIVSMLGAFTLIRPHSSVTRWEAMRCALGVSLYFALIFVYYSIYLGHDISSPSPLLHPGGDATGRSVLRILVFLLVTGIVLGIRPAAVGLAVRSVIVRTGRVDRQSMIALLASLGIAALGDLLSILAQFTPVSARDVLEIVSIVVISLGSVLFTVGLINICSDTVRLYPVIRRPGVGLGDIFETNRQKTRRTEGI